MSETKPAPRPPDIGRRTLTPFGYAVCVAVPILIAALGFTYLHFHYDKEQLVDGTKLNILTSDWKPGEPGDDALVTGQLVYGDDHCLRFESTDGATVELVWPADYEASVQRVNQADQIKVYDPDRDIVARSSQTLELGGGFSDAGEYAGLACAPGSGQVFLVQAVPRVIDASS